MQQSEKRDNIKSDSSSDEEEHEGIRFEIYSPNEHVGPQIRVPYSIHSTQNAPDPKGEDKGPSFMGNIKNFLVQKKLSFD